MRLVDSWTYWYGYRCSAVKRNTTLENSSDRDTCIQLSRVKGQIQSISSFSLKIEWSICNWRTTCRWERCGIFFWKIESTGVHFSRYLIHNSTVSSVWRHDVKTCFRISASQMKFATNSTVTSVLDLISLKQEAAHTIMWVKAASWGSEVQTESNKRETCCRIILISSWTQAQLTPKTKLMFS